MPWEDGTLKYDLHRHMGGCISPTTVATLLNKQGRKTTVDEITSLMVCTKRERKFSDFLARFNILNEIHWTEQAIIESIDQVVRDQAHDGIDMAQLSFSIDKYMENHIKWTRPELIKFVSDAFINSCDRWHTEVELILSLRMEQCRDRQLVNAALIRRDDVAERLHGIDIVGDESKFDTRFYAPIFRDWRAAGKTTLAHVGETGGADNVFDAITVLHVHRVRHGLAAAGDQDVLAAARDLGVGFDVALHSNLLAGTISDLWVHPLPALLRAGCQITLGTDDPVIFNCALADEYKLGRQYGLFGQTEDEISKTERSLRRNAITFAGVAGYDP